MRLQKRKTLLAVVILVIVAAALVLVWRLTAPTGETGAKTVTVQVVHGDGTAKDFTLETDEAYLGPALVAGGVVEDNQGPYGLYILVADGETADEGAQEWWKLTQDGEMINTSADTTPIADGEHFELSFMVGFDEFKREAHGGQGAGAPGPAGRPAVGKQDGPGLAAQH